MAAAKVTHRQHPTSYHEPIMPSYGRRTFRSLGLAGLSTLLLAVATGCQRNPRITALENRVDSMAVALTAIKGILERQGAVQPSGPDTLTVGVSGAGILGKANAPVTIVEFTDYQCPFCARHANNTFAELKKKYIDAGLVRYVLRDNPLPIHPFAPAAAAAARCADEQRGGAYWEYHEALFTNQKAIADTLFPIIAKKMELDAGKLATCMKEARVTTSIEADGKAAMKGKLQATPAFVIGTTRPDSITGKVIIGAYGMDRFGPVVDALLKKQITMR